MRQSTVGFSPSPERVRVGVDWYERYYPEYTRESLERAVSGILQNRGSLDSLTVDYWLKPKISGGRGYGRLRIVQRHMRVAARLSR